MMKLRLGGRKRTRGGLVTVGTVVGLLVAVGATLFGVGAANNSIANFDASAWLWSSKKGEVARVNGVTGHIDTRYQVADAGGHTVQVSQTDRYVLLRDVNTGKVSVLDLASLKVGSTMPSTPGIGVSIALQGNTAFIVDAVQGAVSQLDPGTLQPVGKPLNFPPGLAGGVFDGKGRLWLMVPSEGTVVAISPAPTEGGKPGNASPSVVRTVAVGDPNHDLSIAVLDAGAAVLDTTASVLHVVRDDATQQVTLPSSGPGAMPARINGANIPVTVADDGQVFLVSGDNVRSITLQGVSRQLKPCVPWANRLYCPDELKSTVHVVDLNGGLVSTIAFTNSDGSLELEVREDHLFINAPNSDKAKVVDSKGTIKHVDKYANDVLGGDPPVEPPPVEKRPPVGPPSAPSNVVASAGNAQARVTWGAADPNGSDIRKYVVEGDGKSYDVGAQQRAFVVTGLTNGQSYTFTVYAVNAMGPGPKQSARPVVPTSDVPDPPATVTARENPDGTVTVSWPAANGLGHKVSTYQVTSISGIGPSAVKDQVGSTDQTTLVIPAGRLAYGTQFGFTVVAVNDIGAGSKDSPASNTVVPYNKPGAPKSLTAGTYDAQGAVQVSWAAATDNGRAITKYVVTGTAGATTRTQDVTVGTTAALTGFADGAVVTVNVTAVNLAGTGPAATATARTMVAPTITLTANPAPGYRSFTVNVSVNGGGGSTTCAISVNGGPASALNCAGQAIGANPASTYNYTVTVTNKVGSASASGSQTTPTMSATVICRNDPTYCSGGIWIYGRPSQNASGIRPLYNGNRFVAVCWTDNTVDGRVDARPWGGKITTVWIKMTDNNYIPYAWVQLDGGDNLANLPGC